MKIFRLLYSTLLEALFPLSPAERELFSYTPAQAFEVLPKAPLTPRLVDETNVGAFHQTLGVFAYKDERVSRLVWNIKYKKSEQAVEIASYALRKVLTALLYSDPALGGADAIVIVPMPITKRRRRERGYNQCELITNEISKYVSGGGGGGEKIIFEDKLLTRVHHTSHQKNKDREERLELEKEIFKVDEGVLLGLERDAHFIIIDDVITTGATIKTAMESMKNAGLKNVRGLALAH